MWRDKKTNRKNAGSTAMKVHGALWLFMCLLGLYVAVPSVSTLGESESVLSGLFSFAALICSYCEKRSDCTKLYTFKMSYCQTDTVNDLVYYIISSLKLFLSSPLGISSKPPLV